MEQNAYKRVDQAALTQQASKSDPDRTKSDEVSTLRVRWFIIPLSIVLCTVQALLTITTSNIATGGAQIRITSTLIPVMGFAVLMLLVLAINPVLRLIRLIRPLGRAELVSIFAAMLVTAGIATFGLTDQLIPLIPAPWNPDWNTPQMGWDEHVLPHLNEKLYLTVAEDPDEQAKDAARQVIDKIRAEHASGTASESGRGAADTLLHVLDGTIVKEGEFERAMSEARSSWPQADVESEQALEVARACYEHNADAYVIRIFRESVPVPKPLKTDGWDKWWQYYRDVFFQIPWAAWASPLGYWLVFVFASYGAFYFLTYVVLGYWTQREKLTFPLARLPEALIPESDQSRGWWPPIFSSAGFWAGFGISFLLLSYNAMASAEWLPGMKTMAFGLRGEYVSALTRGNFLEGLTGGPSRLMFAIMFTAVGISFLLPTEISFSVWFYFWIGKLVILIATWMGYGRTGDDFPAMWLWETNAVTSMGAGGLLFFSAVSLFRSIVEYLRLAKGKTLGRRVQLLMPVIGLLVCLTIVVGWLCWNWWPSVSTPTEKLSIFLWASVFVLFLTLLTLGLMRVVAESGIYWIQNFGGSFFHLYKALGLGAVFKSALVAPLLPIYSVLFLDIKTFIAPNLPNAAKVQEDVGTGRRKFHLNLVLCIVVTVMFSTVFTVYMAHERGADQMEQWFYTSFPKDSLFPAVKKVTTSDPEFDPVNTAWYATGGGWVGLTMYLRRSLFWFPHPIGFIMMNNPLTASLWFSFFLGWVAKTLVVRYGGKLTFDKVRLIFIGLIMGELTAVFFWPMISLFTGANIGTITLNRYGP